MISYFQQMMAASTLPAAMTFEMMARTGAMITGRMVDTSAHEEETAALPAPTFPSATEVSAPLATPVGTLPA